jgi:general secretion pathway protein C
MIAMAALLHARIVGTFVARALTVPASPSPLVTSSPPAPSWHRTSARYLLGEPPVEAAVDRPVARSGDPYDAPPCSGVRATTVAVGKNVTASFATLDGGPGERATQPRRQGDRYGKRVVWLVAADRVWLSGDDGLCQAALLARAAVVAATSASTHAPAAPIGDVGFGIERRGVDDYAIDRKALETLFEQAPALAKGARAGFEQVDGRTVGLRLAGVRAGDPLASLGLESGDRVERIAGVELTGPDKALEAYARVRTIANVAIVVRRGDKLRTIDVTVR